MERLVKELQTSPTIEQHFLREEIEPVVEQLGSLLKLIPTFKAMLKVVLSSVFPPTRSDTVFHSLD